MSLEALLSRLEDARPNGRDRWRAACPVCGGGNRSTLSIGSGDTGAVLLRCWKGGCGPDQIAQAVGLDLEDLFPQRDRHGPSMRRRRLITASQALEVLEAEATLLIVYASDLSRGEPLPEDGRDRLLTAAARIAMIREEVRA